MPKIVLRLELATYKPDEWLSDPVECICYEGPILVSDNGAAFRPAKEGQHLPEIQDWLASNKYEVKPAQLVKKASQGRQSWRGLYEFVYIKGEAPKQEPPTPKLSPQDVEAAVGGVWAKDPGAEALRELQALSNVLSYFR
jgi:hypothetical protein